VSATYGELRALLNELFEFDHADLDFGIYRVMNVKRAEIARFLDTELLPQVKTILAGYGSADRVRLETELRDLEVQARAMGMDADASPVYREKRDALTKMPDASALEGEVYAALVAFFRRYYSEGDFLSLRRYKAGVYAIPYEGEEVKLHWANADQYYVKTTERFQDYRFQLSDGRHVHFRLVQATTERDNNKPAEDEERRFVLREHDYAVVQDGELTLLFEYDVRKEKQGPLNAHTIARILADDALSVWLDGLKTSAHTEKEPGRTLLAKHLNDYTAKNSFDYFIHKDLGGFLRRELDFFIKNEIIHLDDLIAETDDRALHALAKARAIKDVARKIIAFLAQLEDFQKRLYLKTKFITRTEYCVTLDRVPEELYETILANDAQWAEWERLYVLSALPKVGGRRVVLASQPYLMVDTGFFDSAFKYTLLAAFQNVDAETNGILVHGDNAQALRLLQPRYREAIECVHIDPPYNTQTSGFLYKNNYQHSSWLTMINERLQLAMPLLNDTGSLLCHIDENEYERLQMLMIGLGLPDAGTIIWDKKNPMLGRKGVATRHEYISWHTFVEGTINLPGTTQALIMNAAKETIAKYGGVTSEARTAFARWLTTYPGLTGGDRASRFLDDEGRVYQSVGMGAPEPRTDPKFFKPLIHPVTQKPCPVPSAGWSRTPETLQELLKKDEIIFGRDETTQPRRKVFLSEDSRRQISSVVEDSGRGKQDVDKLGLEFPYCHPLSLYVTLVGSAAQHRDAVVLDFFAGSGTNGHAVIALNREQGSNRKYVLVEVGDHFGTVLKPRIMKAIFSKDWGGGVPQNHDSGISQLVKYITLESYEDTLNNLVIAPESKQLALLPNAPETRPAREDFALNYLLAFDTEGSPSLLDVDDFAHPDAYTLRITDGGEIRAVVVDLAETFNYLLGLRVRTVRAAGGIRSVEGIEPDGSRALVLWRTVGEHDDDALWAFMEAHGYIGLPREAALAHVYVNGDTALAQRRPAGEAWDVLLTEAEFKRRMFAGTD